MTEKLTGAHRVLNTLKSLARWPDGIKLDALSLDLDMPKSSLHRALQILHASGLVDSLGQGTYRISNEFIALAQMVHEGRSASLGIQPILENLAAFTGETAHFAILDGREVVYLGKASSPGRAVTLTSVIGGRNPAHSTSVGKLLLSQSIHTLDQLQEWIGNAPLEARTPATLTDPEDLFAELNVIRAQGFATEREENEPGVSCVALPWHNDSYDGAISISTLEFRTPIDKVVEQISEIRAIVAGGTRMVSPR